MSIALYKPDKRKFLCYVILNCGTNCEGKQHGLAHVFEHYIINIMQELYVLQEGKIYGFTGYYYMVLYWYKDSHIEAKQSIDTFISFIQKDIYSKFDRNILNKSKDEVLFEIENINVSYLSFYLFNLFPPIGNSEMVRKIDRDDIMNFASNIETRKILIIDDKSKVDIVASDIFNIRPDKIGKFYFNLEFKRVESKQYLIAEDNLSYTVKGMLLNEILILKTCDVLCSLGFKDVRYQILNIARGIKKIVFEADFEDKEFDSDEIIKNVKKINENEVIEYKNIIYNSYLSFYKSNKNNREQFINKTIHSRTNVFVELNSLPAEEADMLFRNSLPFDIIKDINDAVN